ncbi:hypothetical protein CSUI_005288, partial [Cystoisospora suis]
EPGVPSVFCGLSGIRCVLRCSAKCLDLTTQRDEGRKVPRYWGILKSGAPALIGSHNEAPWRAGGPLEVLAGVFPGLRWLTWRRIICLAGFPVEHWKADKLHLATFLTCVPDHRHNPFCLGRRIGWAGRLRVLA